MGVLVALFILRSGVEIIRKAMDQLLGEAPSQELVAEIQAFVRSYPGVLDCHDLVIHSYGPGRRFASIHAEVPAEEDILVSHDIIDTIERDILAQKGVHLVIHMDPVAVGDPQLEYYRGLVKEALAAVGEGLSFHDLRLVAGPQHTKLVFDITAPFAIEEICRQVQEALQQREEKLLAAITVDRV